MAMQGQAALALWFDVAPAARAELEHWHAHEHFPERLSLPGFLRGSRWTATDGGEGFFVLYELQDHGVLGSAPYLASLNAPSPWSTRMMPLHRQMVRAQCRVLLSHGAVTARHALTIRCSPADGSTLRLQQALQTQAAALVQRPGLVGVHLLRHDAPPLAVTTEQKIRGLLDRAADGVIVACGYDAAALHELDTADWNDHALQALGCAPGSTRQLHTLAYAATAADLP